MDVSRLIDQFTPESDLRTRPRPYQNHSVISFDVVTPRERAEGKALLARDYPVISRERAIGVNYMAENHWNSAENLSGLKQRVARLLGIRNLQRRNLHCEAVITKLFSTRKFGNRFRLEIKDSEQNIIFKSKRKLRRSTAFL